VRTGVFVLLALALPAAAATAAAEAGSPGSTEPLAMLRAPRAADVLPARFRSPYLALAETRLVAKAPRAGSARLYLVQTAAGDLCELLVYGGRAAGGGCRPLSSFFRPGSAIAAVSGRFFAGVAANDVAQVVVIDRRGARHGIGLSADHGFIVGCNGPDGCACSIAWAEAYGLAGELLSRDRWLAPRCWLRPL
jgi:hypothetical protein